MQVLVDDLDIRRPGHAALTGPVDESRSPRPAADGHLGPGESDIERLVTGRCLFLSLSMDEWGRAVGAADVPDGRLMLKEANGSSGPSRTRAATMLGASMVPRHEIPCRQTPRPSDQ